MKVHYSVYNQQTPPLKGFEVLDDNGETICKRDSEGHLIKAIDWHLYDEDGYLKNERRPNKTR